MGESVYGGAMRGVPLEFRNVTKIYGREPRAGREQRGESNTPGAVNDLSLTVPAGKICVLVGPSGCGKTTSLKMVNLLIEPTSGEILLDGRSVLEQDPIVLRRGIGYVIQQVGLLPHQTVAENVATVPRLLGWDKKRQAERVEELLTLVGLEPGQYGLRYPAQLSGGERQRVGVARALAADPPLMLMDEPFGAVDPIVRERLQNELLQLQDQLAKTILFVTHDIDEAIKMGDLVAVMQAGGRLAQFGPPEEVLAQPASDFVARFVGADRGLKRLALTRVRDLALLPPVTARLGESAAAVRSRLDGTRHLLLVDDAQRPIGWLAVQHVPQEGALGCDDCEPAEPLLAPRTTLKDALSMLLSVDVMTGIVVDDRRRVLGLITLDEIAAALRPAIPDA
ncbi:betaine/proline/choline family ABC transporter ATP-binding protein [soil metagenome]